MKVRLTQPMDDENGKPYPKDYINERPDSFWWLQMGVAEPVDDEAKAAQKVYDARRARLKAGIEQKAQSAFAEHLAEEADAEKVRQAEFAKMLLEGT